MSEITREEAIELGRAIVSEIVGGEPTVERIMYWYALEQQKKRQQIRVVKP